MQRQAALCCPKITFHTAYSTLQTSSHFISSETSSPRLVSSHLTYSHLISSHMSSKFFSTIFISADHRSTFHSLLMEALLNSSQLFCASKCFYCQYFPALLFALQDLHKVLPSTPLYYKTCTTCFLVLFCTTRLAQCTSQYYFVLQDLHKVLPSPTLH